MVFEIFGKKITDATWGGRAFHIDEITHYGIVKLRPVTLFKRLVPAF
jgi:hypothetical protein